MVPDGMYGRMVAYYGVMWKDGGTWWHGHWRIASFCGVNHGLKRATIHKMGVKTSFMLDSRRVLAPAPKVLGPKHISNPDVAPL